MSEEHSIPVCTLFNQNDEAISTDGDFFSQQPSNENSSKTEAEVGNSEKSLLENSTKEPVVCNLFKTVSPAEDIFASVSAPSSSTDNTNNELFEKENLPEADGQLVSNQSDLLSSNPEVVFESSSLEPDGTFPRSELSQIFNAVVADEKSEPIGELDTSENTSLAHSGMMASILINDDSFDNISNISMEQSLKLDTPDTETIEASVTIENENGVDCGIVESSDVVTMKFPLETTEINDELQKSDEEITSAVAIKDSAGSAIQDQAEKGDAEITAILVTIDEDSSQVELPFCKDESKELAEKGHSQDDMFPVQIEEVEKEPQPLAASMLFAEPNSANPFDAISKATSSNQSDDAFSNALHTSEVDRRRDAWFPNESTSAVLMAVMQSRKRISLEPGHLTRPGLATSETLGDPVKAVLARHKGMEGTCRRDTLSSTSVSCDKVGLQRLVESGNLRAAVDLCGLALTKLGQGFGCATQESTNSPASLQWWQARMALLLRLKLYDLAMTELKQFGSFDSADLFYEFYPDLYPGRRGSMVPFSLRLLYADLPRHLNKPMEALSRLYAMRSVCTKIINNVNSNKSEDGSGVLLKPDDRRESLKLWNQRKVKVLYCIGNTLLQLREYHAAIDVFDDIIKAEPKDSVSLLSGVGRALLQLGDVKAAQQRFAQAERIASGDPQHRVQLISNRGFLYLGANNWKEALNQFSEALRIDPSNLEALNNKSVCLLYLCRLKEAIEVQEEAVRFKKQATSEKTMDSTTDAIPLEGALSNLVTLYELESSKSVIKKKELLSNIAIHNGDGFNVACLKM